MIDSFKKALRYILCNIVKYTPVAGPGIQEDFNKEVRKNPWELGNVPVLILKTQEMCKEAAEADPYTPCYVSDHLRTAEMYEKAVEKYPLLFIYIPDKLKT